MRDGVILCIGETKIALVRAVAQHFPIESVRSGRQALTYAEAHPVALIILDAASMKTSGHRICKTLHDRLDNPLILYIYASDNGNAVPQGVSVCLKAPVKPDTLFQTLTEMLQQAAQTQTPKMETVCCGPFQLDPLRRTLIAYGEVITLSPKQADLLAVFLRHPNQIIERSMLMKTIWDTDYLGDTRTLSVHIRWLRKALGRNNAPHGLKTVRGIGYVLDLDELNAHQTES